MATHFKFEHDFDIDVKDYWDLFFSEEYNVDLYKELKMKERTKLEQTDDGKTLRRATRLTPSTKVPDIFKKVISDMSYTERNVFHRERSEMEVVVEPSMMKDKFDLRGIYSVRPLGEGRCRRKFEGDAKVSVFLVGGQIEKFMIEEIRKSYDVAANVTRRWIVERKAASKPAT
jgi:hypothetical protein